MPLREGVLCFQSVGNALNAERQWRLVTYHFSYFRQFHVGNALNAERQWRLPLVDANDRLLRSGTH